MSRAYRFYRRLRGRILFWRNKTTITVDEPIFFATLDPLGPMDEARPYNVSRPITRSASPDTK